MYTQTPGNLLLGVTDSKFKNNVSVSVNRPRRSLTIQLGTTKPPMIEVVALFSAAMSGTKVDSEAFQYHHPSGMLSMYNITPATGLIEDDSVEGDESYLIPISYQPREPIILTNIYAPETDI